MVRTQAQHIALALTAFALVAVPLTAAAQSLPVSDGETDLAVDGSIHNRIDEQVVLPVATPLPLDDTSQTVGFRLRTYDLVLPSPVGPIYRFSTDANRGFVPSGVGSLVVVDGQAIRVLAGPHATVVPWYYMMDDQSVRPYHALFWDTGTDWYMDFTRAAATPYTGVASPMDRTVFDTATTVAPSVWVRTGVEEIDLAATVAVVLRTAVESTGEAPFQRTDGFVPVGEAPLTRLDDHLALEALPAGGEALDTASTVQDAAAREPTGTLPAQSIAPTPVLPKGSLEAVTAGAIGFLAGLALYHLIRKSAILKNKVRAAIADDVARHPGATITEIAKAVGVTHQTASYHLRLLQEHGLVVGVERGNKRLYFRNDGSFNQEERGLVAVLRDPESMRLLDLIRENPWIMKNEAAAALGVSRNTLNWHLQKLLNAALVSEARENGHCFLFCNRQAAGETLGTVQEKVEARNALGVGEEPVPTNGNGNGHVPARYAGDA